TAAAAAGVTRPTLSLYETGHRTPGIDVCQALADAYGLTLDELTGRAPLPALRPATPTVDAAEAKRRAAAEARTAERASRHKAAADARAVADEAKKAKARAAEAKRAEKAARLAKIIKVGGR
ncbi:MAG: XRE family transcriptional regulator, partial [Acidimicrobiia bacterium]